MREVTLWGKWRGARPWALASLICLAAAPAGAVTHQSTIDFSDISLDCVLNHNLTGRASYSHPDRGVCHPLEASLRGPFFDFVWGAPICKKNADDKTCFVWGSGCCMSCSAGGGDHAPEFNRGKAFVPGIYHQTLTVEPPVPTEPGLTDKISGSLEIYFSQTSVNDTRGCARRGAGSPGLAPGDVWDVTVIIPDRGQTVRLDKDGPAPDNGDGQEGLVGVALKPFKVIVTKKVDAGARITPVGGVAVDFRLRNSAGTLLKTVTGVTLGDGRTQAEFARDDPVLEPGKFTVEATCAGCAGEGSANFGVRVLNEMEARSLLPVSGIIQRGYYGERLREGLGVIVVNRFTQGLVDGVPINFEIMSAPTCPVGSADLTALWTQTDKGLATTAVTLGQQTATCQARALCAAADCPPDGASAQFSFSAAPPPHMAAEQGRRVSGGPSPVSAKRDENFLGIEYRPDFMPSAKYLLTDPPAEAFVGLLVGDEFSLRARSLKASGFRWSGPVAEGLLNAEVRSLRFAARGGELKAPLIETLERLADGRTASARFLVRQPPQPLTGLSCAASNADQNVQLALLASGVCERLFPPSSVADFGLRFSCGLFVAGGAQSYHRKAEEFAEGIFEPKGRRQGSCWNNCCDAAKHMHWHANASRRVSVEFAFQAGLAHEVESLCDHRHNEVVMDLMNNEMGHGIGSGNADIDSTVEQSIKGGAGVILWNTSNRGSSSLLVRSDGCK